MSKITDLVHMHLDIPGLVNDVLDQIVEKSLLELVKRTDNPWDDAVVAALYPPLEAIMKAQLQKLWNDNLAPEAAAPAAPTA